MGHHQAQGGLYKKAEGQYSTVWLEQASLVSTFIIMWRKNKKETPHNRSQDPLLPEKLRQIGSL